MWPIYVLAGGKSTRFGSDKARFIWQGLPLIQHVAQSLQPQAQSLHVVGGQYADLGFDTLQDHYPAYGPLGGLHTALHHTPTPWLFLTSCDLLGFDPQWLHLLWERRQENSQALAFYTERWEPLFAFYHTSLLPMAEAAILRGELALWKLLDQAKTIGVQPPVEWKNIKQVNHPRVLLGE